MRRADAVELAGLALLLLAAGALVYGMARLSIAGAWMLAGGLLLAVGVVAVVAANRGAQ